MFRKIIIALVVGWFTFSSFVLAQDTEERKKYQQAQEIIDQWRGDPDKIKEAETILQEMLKGNPKSALAYVGLGRLTYKRGYINQDNYEAPALKAAKVHLNRAIELDPRLFDAYFYSAYVYLFSRDLPEAKKMVAKAEEIDPKSARVDLLAAEIAVREGNMDEVLTRARQVLDKTHDRKPQLDAHTLLRKAYLKKKEYDKAENSYLKSIELDPDSPWALINYSSFLSDVKGDFDQAMTYAKKSLALMDFGMGRKIYAKACRGKGLELLFKKDSPEEAIKFLQMAVDYYPSDAEAFYGLGAAYARQGFSGNDQALLNKAEKFLLTAVEVDPSYPQAREELRSLLVKRREIGGPAEKKAEAPVPAAEMEKQIVSALQDFVAAQKSHLKDQGYYAPQPELLVGYGRINRDLGLSIDPRLPFHGYYFLGLLDQGQGKINLKTGFILVAVPAVYGPDIKLTYAVGPTGKILKKDLGGQVIKNISQIDASWKIIE